MCKNRDNDLSKHLMLKVNFEITEGECDKQKYIISLIDKTGNIYFYKIHDSLDKISDKFYLGVRSEKNEFSFGLKLLSKFTINDITGNVLVNIKIKFVSKKKKNQAFVYSPDSVVLEIIDFDKNTSEDKISFNDNITSFIQTENNNSFIIGTLNGFISIYNYYYRRIIETKRISINPIIQIIKFNNFQLQSFDKTDIYKQWNLKLIIVLERGVKEIEIRSK